MQPPGIFLREHRKHAGLTQEQLAEKLGTDKGTVSRLENGKCRITVDRLTEYARALDSQPQAFFRLPGELSLDSMVSNIPSQLRKQIEAVVLAMISPYHER